MTAFHRGEKLGNIGEKVGFIFSYCIFTSVLFLSFSLMNKLPQGWGFFHVAGVTLLVTLSGFVLAGFLE